MEAGNTEVTHSHKHKWMYKLSKRMENKRKSRKYARNKKEQKWLEVEWRTVAEKTPSQEEEYMKAGQHCTITHVRLCSRICVCLRCMPLRFMDIRISCRHLTFFRTLSSFRKLFLGFKFENWTPFICMVPGVRNSIDKQQVTTRAECMNVRWKPRSSVTDYNAYSHWKVG